jgi:probable F420-dependent oxidoreductase
VRLTVAPWGGSLAGLVTAARDAEAAGADAAWVSELDRSAPVQLAAIAAATSRVRVGTAIALAFVRSPLVTALEAMDLDELSEGRLVLGLGSGVRRLNEDWHHARWGRPVGHLRETVRAVRELVARSHLGEPIELDGEHEPVRIRGYQRPHPPTRPAIPIYLASVGPEMTRLAGEIGDGWIGHELGSPANLRDNVLPRLSEGSVRSGRSLSDIEVVASACCVPYADGRQARRWAAGQVAFYATVRTYEDFFAWHGFRGEAKAVREAFRSGDERGMVDAVPDAMVDALTLAGTPDEVRSRLAEYDGLADAVKLSPPTRFVPPEATRVAQDEILRLVAGAR